MRAWRSLFIVALCVGAFLHFRNLYGAVYLSEDEARALAIMPSGPLMYLICKPGVELFDAEWGAYYTIALLGFVSIILVWSIVRRLFDEELAAYAALFYAVYPFRINFSRALYPAVFIDFFLLLALLFFLIGTERRRAWPLFAAGICSACPLFLHFFSGYLLLGSMAAGVWFWRTGRRQGQSFSARRPVLLYFLGFFLAYLIIEQAVAFLKPGFQYTAWCLGFGSEVRQAALEWGNNFAPFFTALGKEMALSPRTLFRSLWTALGIGAAVFAAFAGADRRMRFFILMTGTTLALYMAAVLLGFQEIRERHLIWLAFFFSLCFAYLLKLGLSQPQRATKFTVLLCSAVFISTSLFESYQVTVETYKTDYVQAWLAENHISKNQVLTDLHLYMPGDTEHVSAPPAKRHPSWGLQRQKYQIIWWMVYLAYSRGLVTHIIPTGMSSSVNFEEGDPFLERTQPVKSWVHPYSSYRYRFFGAKVNKCKPIYVNVYRLSDIFAYVIPPR